MEPKRIIAFGCSYTFGHGLSDCFQTKNFEPGPSPSQLAWPQLVANSLGWECVNLGVCGAGNKQISHIAHRFEFGSRDVAVFLWSYIHRHCIIDPLHPDHDVWYEQKGSVHPSVQSKEDRMWLKHFYREEDAVWEYNQRQDWIWRFLRDKGIPSYHMSAGIRKGSRLLEFNQAEQLDVDFLAIIKRHGRALDGVHPDHLAQQELADSIIKQLSVKLNM